VARQKNIAQLLVQNTHDVSAAFSLELPIGISPEQLKSWLFKQSPSLSFQLNPATGRLLKFTNWAWSSVLSVKH
jgi:hypothetical protein